MIGAGPKRKKVTGLVQNATTTTSLGEMFATVVKHRSQEVAEASAVTIAEGTTAGHLDEGHANQVAGVQKARVGPAVAEISRGAFI